MLSRQRDQGAGRPSVGIDKSVGRDGRPIQSARDFLGAIKTPAVSVHFENDRACAVALGSFLGTSQEHQQRRRYFAAERNYDDVTFMNNLSCVTNPQSGNPPYSPQ